MGDTINIPLFVSQMNTGWTGEMSIAQYNAHKANPGKIILVGPKYQYQYSDQLHLRNNESKNLGEMLAKVIHEVAVKGNTWNPLMPTYVYRTGNVITVDFHIPVGTLVLDTTIFAMRPDFGFEFAQTGGNTVSIDAVNLINNNTQVQITLSAAPTGTNQLLRYAYTCGWSVPGYPTCGNSVDSTFVGGNIRDMDNAVSTAIGSTGMPLHNWLVAFEEPIQTSLSTTESSKPSDLLIYPNPATERLEVTLQDQANAIQNWRLMDLSGKEIKQWDESAAKSSLVIDVSDLAKGVYMLTVGLTNGAVMTEKVVVQ